MQMRQFPAVAIALAVLCGSGQALRGQPPRTAFPLATPPGPQTYPTPLDESNAGFRPIFDGKSLDGWDTDPGYWRVENGMLAGEVTPATLLKQNNFAIWPGMSGLIEVQVHVGPPIKVEYMSILLKELP